MHYPLAVDLSSKALDVHRRQLVADPVHAAPAVAPADDRHQLARVREVVSGDEPDERVLRRSAAEDAGLL
jgi:hypothetical protein